VFKLNGEREREVTACDVMTMEKTIETMSLCLVAAHIVSGERIPGVRVC
jgi:hypothetical protein